MRILFIDDYARRLGGVSAYLANLLPALKARGHAVGLCGPVGTRNLLREHVISEYLSNPLGWSECGRALWSLCSPLGAVKVRKALAEFRPDVVHLGGCTSHLGLAWVKALEQVPTVYRAHNYELVRPEQALYARDLNQRNCDGQAGWICVAVGCRPLWKQPADRLMQWMSRRAQRWIDRVVAASTALVESLRRTGWANTTYLPLGVPLGEFQEGRRGQVIIYVGRLSPEKGVQVLLRAMPLVLRRLPNCQAWLAGDGRLRGQLMRQAKKLGVSESVRFLGPVGYGQLPSLHAGAGALVAPSVCAESFGLSVAEAQAWGTPVIASDVGGLAELVRDRETGLLCRPNDPQDLSDRMVEILTDTALARALARNARTFAERHLSFDVHADRLLETCQQVADSRPSLRQ